VHGLRPLRLWTRRRLVKVALGGVNVNEEDLFDRDRLRDGRKGIGCVVLADAALSDWRRQ
jgi:hypothetical protein